MTYLILQTLADGRTKQTPVTEGLSLDLQEGANYSLIDAETQQPPQGLKLIKRGNSLLIEDEGKEIAELNEFFAEGSDATFTTDGTPLASDASTSNLLSSQSETILGEEGLIWSAESASSALALSPLTLLGGTLSAGALAAGVSAQTITLESTAGQNTNTSPSVNNPILGSVRVALRSDLGIAGDNISSIGSLDVTGVDAGATIEYSLDSGTTWSTTFNANEGLNQLQVRQNDNNGNVSPPTTFSFTLDTAAPSSSPSATVSPTGGLVVSGTEANASVEYSIDGGNSWTTSFTPVEGNNSVQVRQVDAAGNPGPASAAVTFNQDTTAPNAPTASFSTATGLTVSGIETAALVEYSIDNGLSWTTGFSPTEGNNSVMVRQTDAAGNVSPVSVAVTFNQDTIAPNAPTASFSTANGITVSGIETAALVEYSIDNGISWTTGFSPAEGNNNVMVRQTDAAGNVSSPSAAVVFNQDTTAPNAPNVALTTDSGVLGDGISNVGTLNVSAVEAGALVEYSVDAGLNWTTSFNAIAGLNNVQVRQTDAAGNISPTTLFSFSFETLVAAPSVTLTTDSGILGDAISNTGALNVTSLAGALVEYSMDAGVNWANNFTAVEGLNNVLIRQTDLNGNVSAATPISFTLDTAVITPTLALNVDSGLLGDGISNSGVLNTTGVEAGAIVEYSVDAGTTWTPSFSAIEGTNSVMVRQTDVAGNVSPPSAAFNFTLDSLLPISPTVALTSDSGLIGDGISNLGAVTVTGLEVGALLEYSIDNGLTWVATFTAIEGNNSVMVRQTDAAGNVSLPSAALVFTLDSLAPITAPVVALTTDSGIVGDNISNVGTLNVTGIELGATVEYSVDAGLTWTTTFTAVAGLNNVQVRQSDAAGNASPVTPFSFTFETLVAAPTVALITDSALADGISNVGTLNVTGLAGALIEYSVDAGVSWTTAFTAAEGINNVLVRQTDLSGNISASTPINFTIDTIVVTPTLALNADSGLLGDGISNSGTLTTTGVEAGATVEYSVNGGINWATTFTAAEGNNSVMVRQTDVAGNVSPASAALTFILDTTAPLAPPTIALTTDSGIATDGISNVGTLSTTGVEAGAIVEYSVNGGINWVTTFTAAEGNNSVMVRQTDVAGNISPASTALVFNLDTTAPLTPPSITLTTDSGIAADGISNVGTLTTTGVEAGAIVEYSVNGGINWATNFTAAEGNNSIMVRQTDVAGNISPASTVLTFTLDTTAPLAPPNIALTTDSGIATDGISNLGTLTTTGVEAGATVEYSVNGGINWATTFTAVEGNNNVMVRQTDAAGNISPASAALVFTLDSLAPITAPVVTLTTDSGIVGDNISNVGTLNVTGIEIGASIEYSVDAGLTWTTTFTAIAGINNVQVRQSDAAGNASPVTPFSFTFETLVAAPTVALTTDSALADGISNVGTLNVTGLAGSLIEYSVDTGVSWTTAFTAAEGINNVLVRQTDLSGNISASTPINFTLDTTVITPTLALNTDSGLLGDGISNSGIINTTGVEAGAIVEYSVDAGTTWTANFTAAEGVNSVMVRQTDVAGNISPASTALTFTLDTTAPLAPPNIALTTDSGIATDGISNLGTLTTTGVEAGATVEYSIDAGTIWATTFAAAEGNNSVMVRQTDVAGNVSPASAVLNFTLDTTAPLIASVTPADNATAVVLTDNIVLNFDGNVLAGSGNFVISDGVGDTRTIAVTDATQVTITGSSVTLNPTTDLAAGSNYNVTYAAGVLTDTAGNGITAQADPLAHNFDTIPLVTTSPIVVFDLINGVSSNHSGRTFDPNVAYSIYVIVDPVNVALNSTTPAPGLTATYGTWSGGNALGADDTLTFISGLNGATGTSVVGFVGNIGTVTQPINQVSSYPSLMAAWTSSQLAMYVDNNGTVGRYMSLQIQFANIWTGSWSTLGLGRDPGNTMIPLPAGLLTSQGLV